MSTTELGHPAADIPIAKARFQPSVTVGELIHSALLPLTSLRLTVALFAISMVLVFAGSLAQIDHDIWYVIQNYFRTWMAWIELKVFFPRTWDVPGVMPFPGGWLLGTALGINLLAAHALRFKMTAQGSTLGIGLGLIAGGIALTYFVVQSGLDDTVESELSPAFCNSLWHAMRFALGSGTLVFGYVLALNYQRQRQSALKLLWWLGAALCALLAALAIWLFAYPEAQLNPSGLRILWQLIKGTAAGLVLLAGCHWVFGRRAGIVLLHGGIALMMFSELFTGLKADEAQMRIEEDQTVTFAEDYRNAELAIVDKSDPKTDKVTVVPLSRLVAADQSGKPVSDPLLPFSVRVADYLPNAVTRLKQPGEVSLATQGDGQLRIAVSRPTSTGASQEQSVDLPAAYLELLSNDDQSSLGTYLFWALPTPGSLQETIEVGGKSYELALRFKRLEKPYAVKLLDFRHEKYVGTDTPKNYSSDVRLIDANRNVDRTFKIWMNNPLRYGGDTLYQASFDPNNPRLTILQVVTNSGWMIPYVACMIVATGMLSHFGRTLLRFLRRREQEASLAAGAVEGDVNEQRTWSQQLRQQDFWIPALVLLIFAGWVTSCARPLSEKATRKQLSEFGKLPVAYGGRLQPLDTLARNTLRAVSGRQYLEDLQGEKQPAIRWLLDVSSDNSVWRKYPVLRIENFEVLHSLNLEPRAGYRYSFEELGQQAEEYDRQILLAREVALAAETGGPELDLPQQKLLELDRKVRMVLVMLDVFGRPQLGGETPQEVVQSLRSAQGRAEMLNEMAARPLPPPNPEAEWQTVLEAELHGLYAQHPSIAPPGDWHKNPASDALIDVLASYREGDSQAFNTNLVAYHELVQQRAAAELKHEQQVIARQGESTQKTAERLDLERIGFEAYFNHFNPLQLSLALYLVAFVLAAGSWLGLSVLLNRSANWLLWFTFVLHTSALICRIYISGRPPVTNLHSSAVFIGWAAVLFALICENIYRFGIGNLLAAAVGFPTLLIAYNLAGDGDTFEVMRAVLDTQFWLATHVVCITLGYSTTLLAGVLGLCYVLVVQVLGKLDDKQRQQLVRMTYGTICFAIFFSFVGTVLGGLWADDSWGRFWGWDPKENGALMIVLWNALVLHARWGGMIGQRGLAVLAIFGNVVTTWSWFGVNQMSVGLHAYGFRSGMAFWLTVFVISQLAVMAVGCVVGRSGAQPLKESP